MAKQTVHNECKAENGELKCRRFRKNSDGTQVDLASASRRVDAQCKEVSTQMGGEEKELDKLNGFMDGKLSVKCAREKAETPSDY